MANHPITNFLVFFGIAILLWMLYRGIQGNRTAFTLENFNHSIRTLGILALILIGMIWVTVLLLRGGR